MDRRLFMQLLVVDCRGDVSATEAQRNLAAALESRQANAVLYEDVNHPTGLGVLSWSEDPTDFVDRVRPAFAEASVAGVRIRPDFTMLGRSYSSGFEPDLEYWLLRRPKETVLNPAWPWAVWYPLRRTGAFERLEPREKGKILHEHATIGRTYGEADLAHDVRLACHGLDANDNEFLIGLIGKSLYPLSHVVQSMRKTRQTSEYISQMGPFFVGRAVWRHDATRG
jgi:chlorite dismutase